MKRKRGKNKPRRMLERRRRNRRKLREQSDPIVDDVLNELKDYGHFVTIPFDGRLSEAVEIYLDVDYWLKEGYDKTYRFISSVVGIPSERQFDEFWEDIETLRYPYIEFLVRMSENQGDLIYTNIDRSYAERMIEQRYKEGTGYFERRRPPRRARMGIKRRNLRERRALADLRAVHTYIADKLNSMYYDLAIPAPRIKDISYYGEEGYKIQLEVADTRDLDPSMLEMQIFKTVEMEDPAVRDVRSEIRGNILTIYVQ